MKNAEDNRAFDSVKVLLYESHLLLAGYRAESVEPASMIHYQFNELGLEGVYSTQIQKIQEYIPKNFFQCADLKVYHAEPQFLYIPNELYFQANVYQLYNDVYSFSTEKVLTEEIPTIEARVAYNYPYRIYNDLNNEFANATFHIYHERIFGKLKGASEGKKIAYVSIKSHWVEFSIWENGALLFANTYKYSTKTDLLYFFTAVFQDQNIAFDSADIFVATIRKEQQDDMLSTLKSFYPEMNESVEAIFGIAPYEWNTYADLLLMN